MAETLIHRLNFIIKLVNGLMKCYIDKKFENALDSLPGGTYAIGGAVGMSPSSVMDCTDIPSPLM